MKQITITIWLLFTGIITWHSLYAQTDSTKNNVFSLGINGVSRFQYFGRTDSLQSRGMIPYIGYQHKCGLYAQGSFIFIDNSTTSLSYTGSLGEIGYRFPTSDHFTGNLYFTKLFYKDNSTLVQSALKYQSGLNAAYTNKIINLNFGADLKFSNKTDVGISPGIDHMFIIKIKNKNPIALAIDPAASIFWNSKFFKNISGKKINIFYSNLTTNNYR